ncbi:hypothetical protein BU23DRAFT_564607 [Bimuria novae-zelandiae CBS 107.79]|uniref:Uncharacterized protein n=1 Tax=Bimuria novae-zelandiae CBS 107.79 TaxID=1447943 RepID=A0A6A5VPV1_9PLEO|nr:hypothetical protein BU23DRAFT_564607 [Bimuria novae-zelandiae CBS 107.79]
MPKKKNQKVPDPKDQKNKLDNYFKIASTPSQPKQNAASEFSTHATTSHNNALPASSPAAPSTLPATPTTDAVVTRDHDSSSPLSLRSSTPRSPGPPDVATYDGATEIRQPSRPSSAGPTSKRVDSRGEQMVLDSDADSDPLTDLDDEPEEPEDKPKPKPTTRAAATPRYTAPKGYEPPPPPRRRKDDDAFRRLVQEAQKNREEEQQIAEAQADLEKSLREDSPERDARISEGMVAVAVKDHNDPEKAKKLYLAMQRTNALHVDCSFHFFDPDLDCRTPKHSPFPTSSLPESPVFSVFKEPASRDQAFLSGFAQQVFRQEKDYPEGLAFRPKLPDELMMWMVDEVCFARSEALSRSYIQLLEAHKSRVGKILDKSKLATIRNGLGAKKMYLDLALEAEVTPSYELDSVTQPSIPQNLSSVCKILQLASSSLGPKIRAQILQTLCLVSMDTGVQMRIDLLSAVQDTIESLIRGIPGDCNCGQFLLKDLIPNLLARIKHPILQQNLVRALPARTPLTAYLQRHLALSFLVHPYKVTQPLSDPGVLELMHAHFDLKASPKFFITKDTDYSVLAAHFTLVDIAIGPGPLVVPYQPLINPPASQDSQGQSAYVPPTPSWDEMKKFNDEVDKLVLRIRLVGNGIKVAGAMTDLSRLAANNCCERLCTRLENAVRIGGRKVENAFSGEEQWKKRSKLVFQNHFKQGTEKRSTDETLAVDGAAKRVAVENGVGAPVKSESLAENGVGARVNNKGPDVDTNEGMAMNDGPMLVKSEGPDDDITEGAAMMDSHMTFESEQDIQASLADQ